MNNAERIERDKDIIDMFDHGYMIDVIAFYCEITPERVRQIIKKNGKKAMEGESG